MNGRILENWPILKEKLRALIAIRDRADMAKEGVTGGRMDGRRGEAIPFHLRYNIIITHRVTKTRTSNRRRSERCHDHDPDRDGDPLLLLPLAFPLERGNRFLLGNSV